MISWMPTSNPTFSRVKAVARCDLEPELRGAELGPVAEPRELLRLRLRAERVSVLARVELDLLDAERLRRTDLLRIGRDEEADLEDAWSRSARTRRGEGRLRRPLTSRPPSVVRSSRRSGTSVTQSGRMRRAMATISSVAAHSMLRMAGSSTTSRSFGMSSSTM